MRLPRSGRARGPGGNGSFLSLVVGFKWFLMRRASRRAMKGVRKTKANILQLGDGGDEKRRKCLEWASALV